MPTPVLSRRDFSARLALLAPVLGIGGFAFTPNRAQGDGIARDAEAIHQELTFAASPARLYEALLDDKRFAAWTGGQATSIDRTPGGALSLFGARIKGRNVELVPNARIVQAWRSEGWDAGIYSIVRFELAAQGAGTKLVFDHTGFPTGQADHLAAGWKSNYWDLLTKYLA